MARSSPKRIQIKEAKKVVYTYGVFDLYHSGHIQLLKKAKKLGNYLVVGLFTDDVAESFKRTPVIPFKHRKKMLEHTVMVDKVVAQRELSPDKNIRKIAPHILAKGPGAGWDSKVKRAPGEETIRKMGGKVVRLPYHHGISTSEIIKKIKN